MTRVISDRYLDLIQKSLQNAIHGETSSKLQSPPSFSEFDIHTCHSRGGRSWPGEAQTMIGETRRANLRGLVDWTLRENIPGGGGACILIRAIRGA